MSRSYKARIPEGERGKWLIDRMTLTKKFCDGLFLQGMREVRDCGESRLPKSGKYTRLIETYDDPMGSPTNKRVMMSDTPAELKDLDPMLEEVYGDVLIHGLGLGCAVDLCLQRGTTVRTITVIEIDQDLIDLVAPTLLKRHGKKLEIIQADAYEWRPKGRNFDTIWSDIWPTIGPDNLPEMARLKRMWRSRCDWHGFWCKEQCRFMSVAY